MVLCLLDCPLLALSNLPFVSKILEKAVLKQLQKHLAANDLVEIHQSAYRKNHSTETAVLDVLDNLLTQADKRLVSLVALLDLSAAFDTTEAIRVNFWCRGNSSFMVYLIRLGPFSVNGDRQCPL